VFRAEGTKGKLLAGGREAATLGAWSLETAPGPDGGTTITATVTAKDGYWSEAAETFTVLLLLGSTRLRWASVSAAFSGNTVTIIAKGRPTD
jgi:hypothetical protein